MARAAPSRLGRTQFDFLQAREQRAFVRHLPGPDETFVASDLPPFLRNRLDVFRNNGIIHPEANYDEAKKDTIWRVDRYVHEYVSDYNTDGGRTLPDGHPFRFVHEDGRIKCKEPGCDNSWAPEKVRAHLDDGGEAA